MGFLPGGSEWIVILLVVVLLFGAKKIPELMRGLGSGIREFKKASSLDEENRKDDKPSKEE
jgi:sec-independent protein translocase protein TatA